MTTTLFAPGNYRYIPAYFQYSSGAAAEPGYSVERVMFRSPLPLEEGFRRAAEHIKGAGRPLTALCACELRSPAQFSDAGFKAFNEHYCKTLAEWGIYDAASKANPVARSNVCPEIGGPSQPSMHAFSFTVARASAVASFVIAGSGESKDGAGPYSERIVRYGETSLEAMREKARHVLGVLEMRLGKFGLGWKDASGTQVYTVHDLYPFLADEIVVRGAARCGFTWHFARPPVQGLEFEMDCRNTDDLVR